MNNFCLKNLPLELLEGTREVFLELGYVESDNGAVVTATKSLKTGITVKENSVEIVYNKKPEFFRMLSLINNDECKNGYFESPRHNSLGYMVDQSRNAVLTVDSMHQFIRYLALLGYDNLMLYTEDTYEIDGEQYFGHLRGRWTKDSIKELDKYCHLFGIELIPCIQTLGHLERAMYWPCYNALSDRDNVLLVGDDKTYALIDKMFATAAECFTSRKINVGLDEAHSLGLGKYLKIHGYRNRFEIMLEHIGKVCEIAKKYGFEPMMWSDMFFRIAFNGNYYVKEGEIPQSVIDKVPENMSLVYWDYYTADRELFSHMADCHTAFKNNKVIFAGGAQRWGRFNAVNEFSIKVESMHIEECLKKGIVDIIGTGWGDDGSESSTFSILPTLALYAEKCYKENFDRTWLETRVEEVFKTPMAPFTLMNDLDYLPGFPEFDRGNNRFSKLVLYADILTGAFYKHIDRDVCVPHYKNIADSLKPYIKNENFGYMFEVMYHLANVCSVKSELINDIRDSYKAGDKQTLNQIAVSDIPRAVNAVNDLLLAVEKQWRKENLTFGLEVQQIRLGGLKERMIGVSKILLDYVNGVIDKVDELEQDALFYDCRPADSDRTLAIRESSWKRIVTVNII